MNSLSVKIAVLSLIVESSTPALWTASQPQMSNREGAV